MRRPAVFTAAILLAACNPESGLGPPPASATADLAGEWFETAIYAGQDVLRGEFPGWTAGEIAIAADGRLRYDDYADALGGTPELDLSSWSVDAAGDVASSSSGATSFHGRLSASRATLVAVTREGSRCSLRLLHRTDPNAAAAAIAGTRWRYHALVTGGATGWEHGTATVDGDRALALVGRTASDGPAADAPRVATILELPHGELVGTDDAGATVLVGWSSSDGALLVLSGTLDDVNHVYWTMIALPEGSGFAQADLAGAHEVVPMDVSTQGVDGALVAGAGWSYGPDQVDADGHVTFGSFVTSGGGTSQPGPVTVRLAADGEASMVENATYDGALAQDGSLFVATATVTPPAGTASSRLVYWVR